MNFIEIKSEALEEVQEAHEHLNERSEEISNICFDYEDQNKIPIKDEIKAEIKPEPLDKDRRDVENEQEKSELQAMIDKLLHKVEKIEYENNKLQAENQNLKSENKYVKRQLEEKENKFRQLSLHCAQLQSTILNSKENKDKNLVEPPKKLKKSDVVNKWDNKCDICGWKGPPGNWTSKTFREKAIQYINKHKETVHCIERHSKTVHEKQRQSKYKCESCKKSFEEISYLKKHIKTVHAKQRDYKCDICGKDFELIYDLKKHLKTKNCT